MRIKTCWDVLVRQCPLNLLMFVVCSGCGQSREEWPRITETPNEYEVRIVEPGEGAVVTIGQPIEVRVEVANLTGDGAPTSLSVSIRHRGMSYDAAGFPLSSEPRDSENAPFVFLGSLKLPGSAPEGKYIIQAQAVSTWVEESTGTDEPPALESRSFKAPEIEVVAK